jgi:signal transduction histidine kinase
LQPVPNQSERSTSPHWYRSLYWRLAFGLIAFLALMLVAEAALFLWMTERIAGSMPARSPRRLAELVASDVGATLASNPTIDLDTYLRDQYGHVFQPFLVVLDDGRIAANHDDIPQNLIDMVREEVAVRDALGRERRSLGRRGPGGPPSDRDAERAFGEGRGSRTDRRERRPPPPRGEFRAILVAGQPVGRVAVLPGGPPLSRIVRELGPTMGLVAAGVLAVGTSLIAFIVFGPARRRLKAVQAATERLGGGDLAARAPEQGGDEVSALARSFNQMADELRTRAQALQASDTARRQLLADVSHELMTPLTAMRGYIETLTMSELHIDQPMRDRYLRIVMEETHRLERIIGDLLDLARLDGGGSPMRQERVEIAALFARVAARHERELSERSIRLAQRVEDGAGIVIGDPDRLEQALQNLAANALRHTPDGGEIGLSSSRLPAGTRLTVRDTGPGIPPRHLPLIFDRFYKADAARKASGGSGLGLSIVKAIVERHGGTITARNDNGAVFDITLPRIHHS